MPYPIINALGFNDFAGYDPRINDIDPLTTQMPMLSRYKLGDPETDEKIYE